MYKQHFKRIIDFIVAFVAFIVLLPILVLVTILLMIANSGKPFFFQTRPGKNEKLFNIVKFKTMTDAKDSKGNLLPDAERMTKIGSFVRKTSLDELPQLINVLIGDMSLIGPRPLLVEYLPLYNKEQKKRHNIRPGITGWAQVNGLRGATPNPENMKKRMEYDLWYLNNWTIWLDLYIIFKTFYAVFKHAKL